MIPLHKPFLSGDELGFMEEAMGSDQIAGNGPFTERCQHYFEKKFGFGRSLLTTSCTSALEMAALLLDLKEGDEVIIPSYTYVTTANAFMMHGGRVVFADSNEDHPNVSVESIRAQIGPKTRAIVVVHYAGMGCDMEAVMSLAKEHDLTVIEDAAHCIGSQYKGQFLGSWGNLSTFSFHATKNITCGEGGMLVINDTNLIERAELLWEKGTNRVQFLKGKSQRYEWFDLGSSFAPSEVTAAFLWAQLQHWKTINEERLVQWDYYQRSLTDLPGLEVAIIPEGAIHNGHLYYFRLASEEMRNDLIAFLKQKGYGAAFHYMALHESPRGKQISSAQLPNASNWQRQLIRIPLYNGLSKSEQKQIVEAIAEFANR